MARKSRRKQNTIGNLLTALIVIIAIFLGANKVNSNRQLTNSNQNQTQTQSKTGLGGLSQAEYQQLAKLDFKSGQAAYIQVNRGKSTLNPQAWQENKVIYANLDKLNRTSASNTAFLEKRNVANDNLRVRQYIEPTGWHGNHPGREIYNRGHLIAYSVSAGIDQSGKYNPHNQSGDQNNPKNLFTQTAYANQRVQTIFETKVRQALRRDCKVVYQATPIFRGNELMARGINLQAVATDGSLNFNVYIFNVQPGYQFSYATGQAQTSPGWQVK
ncbi:MAG: DNA/RNA non-specific endonuclease [Lactobacillus sp.]|jgi:DNA-entry nuclease|nr:DNA/RNA non-specific endonuclease [Lactobacillus sp.]MCH4068353.1 DNA/RNA non-specific endonuclease [Lactobacillus sp.]MCI1304366.1 DNA/RNA non-specific endonuclease [Lactobacillus sp.]MCI1330352.1 DNA/RNA non-specific endonuclease [Lactobacillus sp.]MCI1359139.1 DNA/RNA non-specific endonuclease [Lactobacillus sp.]